MTFPYANNLASPMSFGITDPMLMGGMFPGGMYGMQNKYSFDQNQQTDSILTYNKDRLALDQKYGTPINDQNFKGSMITSGVTGATGAAVGYAIAGNRRGATYASSAKGAMLGAVVGFALPTIAKGISNIFD